MNHKCLVFGERDGLTCVHEAELESHGWSTGEFAYVRREPGSLRAKHSPPAGEVHHVFVAVGTLTVGWLTASGQTRTVEIGPNHEYNSVIFKDWGADAHNQIGHTSTPGTSGALLIVLKTTELKAGLAVLREV